MPRLTAGEVILEIIRQSDGEFSGKTRLFKAFYFAHLAYYDKYPGVLTSHPIARMPNGPGIDDCDALFHSLTERGMIEIETYHDGFFPEFRYRLTDRAKDLPPVPVDAASAIQRAVDFVRDKSAAYLSQYTHEHSRSWTQGKDGEVLNIYIDLIPEDTYGEQQAELDRIGAVLKEAGIED